MDNGLENMESVELCTVLVFNTLHAIWRVIVTSLGIKTRKTVNRNDNVNLDCLVYIRAALLIIHQR